MWLWGFQGWAAERVVAAASTLRTEKLTGVGAVAGGLGTGSIHDILAHIVGAEELWLRRWQGEPRAPLPAGSDFSDMAEVAIRWRTVERGRSELLEGLSEPDLDREVEYLSVTWGVEEHFPLWETMLHLVNHTTHHRADACTALTALGCPPASVDLIDYLRAGRDS
jgi:uncharacterized damage-inducible protein DinB